MKLTKDTVLAGIENGDRHILGNSLDEIMALINNNPFAKKIIYLLCNQRVATIPVRNLLGESSKPNCLGTCFYIAGVSELLYPYHAYSRELEPHVKSGRTPEEVATMLFPDFEKMIPGAFIFSYSSEQDDWHAGIYLGKIADVDIAFSQHGHGRLFGPEVVNRNYANPNYYIPSTLKIMTTQ